MLVPLARHASAAPRDRLRVRASKPQANYIPRQLWYTGSRRAPDRPRVGLCVCWGRAPQLPDGIAWEICQGPLLVCCSGARQPRKASPGEPRPRQGRPSGVPRAHNASQGAEHRHACPSPRPLTLHRPCHGSLPSQNDTGSPLLSRLRRRQPPKRTYSEASTCLQNGRRAANGNLDFATNVSSTSIAPRFGCPISATVPLSSFALLSWQSGPHARRLCCSSSHCCPSRVPRLAAVGSREGGRWLGVRWTPRGVVDRNGEGGERPIVTTAFDADGVGIPGPPRRNWWAGDPWFGLLHGEQAARAGDIERDASIDAQARFPAWLAALRTFASPFACTGNRGSGWSGRQG